MGRRSSDARSAVSGDEGDRDGSGDGQAEGCGTRVKVQGQGRWTGALAVAVIVVVAAVWLARPAGEPDAASAPPVSTQTEQATTRSPSLTPSPTSSPSPTCDRVSRPFAPRTITVAGVTAGATVVTSPRDVNGVPGVPPLTSAGKSVFAWDREQGIRPGDPAGNVLLNAHTWPDGSALGNRLLAGLDTGDRIVVQGADSRLCYRVTERVEVPAERGLPRYYKKRGPPQLAIVVCSGRRLGPGLWENRTVWFASPST